ncbi:EAL domain-containing protein [Campylobacter mucosalis]|uniref:PAS sensor-containing diguanylate cyclase/phosphodiesterase n=1 Tax=Campylobacter mucosalis CCUG 21559 TaxID=1032067 RepID=A0A6G5QDX4_9BACT|nr:EAL domain-containing protein [Campylobacter mucosalis]QCD43893.1 PAS sensor-containing diguanylate cyclase/phosphodiesterase [Campylobacter mucosalis CCUG 21559]
MVFDSVKGGSKTISKFIALIIIFISLVAMCFVKFFDFLQIYTNLDEQVKIRQNEILIQRKQSLKNNVYEMYYDINKTYQNELARLQSELKSQIYKKVNSNIDSLDKLKSILKSPNFAFLTPNGEILSGKLEAKFLAPTLLSIVNEDDAIFVADDSVIYASFYYPLNIVIVYKTDLSTFNLNFIQNLKQRLLASDMFLLSKEGLKQSQILQDNAKISEDRFKSIMGLVKNSDKEGFYVSPNLDDSGEVIFAKDINAFSLVLVARARLSDIYKTIADEKAKLNTEILNQLFLSIFYFIALLSVVAILAFFVKKWLSDQFANFLNYFDKGGNEHISKDEFDFDEFRVLANKINYLVDEKICQTKQKEQKALLLSQYENTLNSLAMVFKFDDKNRIIYANDSLCMALKKSRQDIVGSNISVIFDKVYKDEVQKLYSDIKNAKSWSGILTINAKDAQKYAKTTLTPLVDVDGFLGEYLAICYDISDFMSQQEQVKRHLKDPLTKLPNRQALLDRIANSDEYAFISSFDILRFKHINEYYGFDMGDRILLEVSRRVLELIKLKHLELFKLTNDNFALLGKRHKWDVNSFSAYARNLVSEFKNRPIILDDVKFSIGLTFGISSEVSNLISSEMAKDYAKQNRELIAIFDDKKDMLLHTINLTQTIKRAIDDERIVLYKQGIIDNVSKKTIKYECLIRMIDDDGKVVSPFEFLNIAKHSNLYKELTKIVITSSFEYFSKNDFNFSINLAIDDILSPEILEFLKAKLTAFSGIGERLTIEILEDEGIKNFQKVNHFINEVRKFGCKVAIDDFGTGYSNFEYLMKLKADFIKIDGSMIKNIDKDSESRRVVELMVEFSKRLGIKTIAEFVHSKDVSSIISDIGIDASQGFYYDEPKPLSA